VGKGRFEVEARFSLSLPSLLSLLSPLSLLSLLSFFLFLLGRVATLGSDGRPGDREGEQDQEMVDKGPSDHLNEIEAARRKDRFGCGKFSKVSVGYIDGNGVG
jgi:hypothetical protein